MNQRNYKKMNVKNLLNVNAATTVGEVPEHEEDGMTVGVTWLAVAPLVQLLTM